MTPQIFAAMYVTAMKFREESWVTKPVKTPATPDAPFSHFSPGFYVKTYEEAALEAVRFHEQDERWATPIEHLMIGSWNDTETWARSQI